MSPGKQQVRVAVPADLAGSSHLGTSTSSEEARTLPGPLHSFTGPLLLLECISKAMVYSPSNQAKVHLDIVEEDRGQEQFVQGHM